MIDANLNLEDGTRVYTIRFSSDHTRLEGVLYNNKIFGVFVLLDKPFEGQRLIYVKDILHGFWFLCE